ncbi:thiamine phosphate synthase [Myxococcota bacterium]|nr:thiamine phosphate synthase [Myxococcota bacterium]
MGTAPGFRVLLVTDRSRLGGRPLDAAVAAALAGAPPGSVAVQLRERDLPPRELLPLARDVGAACRGAGAPLFVNDRLDVALGAGADGLHLGEGSLPPTEARRLVRRHGFDLLLSAACHDAAGLARAGAADLALLAPVFPTPGKAAPGEELGLALLAELARGAALPVFALGGVDPDRARACREAGAAGVAAISAVWGAPDPAEALAALVKETGTV